MSAWIVQIEEESSSLESVPTTQGRRMYQIPDSEGNKVPDFRDVYEPYIVSIKPPYDVHTDLMGMVIKTNCRMHFMRRSGITFEIFLTVLRKISDELLGAYGLSSNIFDTGRNTKIDGDDDFLKMMLINGIFLLEFIYTMRDIKLSVPRDKLDSAITRILENREEMKRCMHDFLLLGNQVPLILLEKIHCHWTGHDRTEFIKLIAATFVPRNGVPNIERMLSELESSMHILDVYRRILVHRDFKREKPPIEKKRKQEEFVSTNIPTATELHNIGIGFAISDSTSLLDTSFQRDTLKLPKIVVDGLTKSIFLNLIAFEQLHQNITRKEVNEYMYLMGCLIQTADDASLLQSCGIIVTTMPPYEVAAIFHRMSKAVSLDPVHLEPEYTMMLRMVRSRFNKLSSVWRKDLFQTYLKTPWAVMSVMAAILLFTLSIIQTVYAVLSYVRPK